MNENDDEKHRILNWDKIHEMVLEKGSNAISGVKPNDVDWFLRDSKVSSDPRRTDQYGLAPGSPKLTAKTLSTPPSPQMATTLSNTNENINSKSRPSISPITEEPAISETFHDDHVSQTPRLRRRSSLNSTTSVGSASSNGSSGGGLFLKLKSKFHRSGGDSNHSLPAITPSSPLQQAVGSKSDSRLSRQISPLPDLSRTNTIEKPLSRTTSLNRDIPSRASSISGSDPRIKDYVRFYKQPDYSRRNSTGSRRLFGQKSNGEVLESCLLNPLPPLKQKAALQDSQLLSGSKLGSLWRKRSHSSPQTPQLIPEARSSESSDSARSTNTSETENMPYSKHLKPLKRVAFHSLTFLIDPPQQIPSRNPRKGNVQVMPDGTVRVNPLSEADKEAIDKAQRGMGGGLVVGGTGALGLIDNDEKEPENEVDIPDEDPKLNNKIDEADTAINKHAQGFAIDKPMVHNRARQGYTVPIKKMALDLMYTRCCHLREILPIPAIAKQIPKGTMAPLPLLQLRNPRPTMIEIQTFADFIRIAPIICLSFDGVNLSVEQFRILLSAISSKKQLKKLSLRNTPIDSEGWSLLCWFLLRNVNLSQLDITQCPPLAINLLKKKKKTDGKHDDEISRMQCNNENRSDMDWALFTATIIARGGIDELVLTGCCINDLEVFEKLISQALLIKTYRIGLAYNQLLPQQIRILLENLVLTENVRGIDLGYNDMLLPAYVNTVLDVIKVPANAKRVSRSKLAFLSLNATNLRFYQSFKEFFEKFVLALPELKYLDMSNNPKLYGNYQLPTPELEKPLFRTSETAENAGIRDQEAICDYFTSKLPLFTNLMRLHIENNGIKSKCLISLSQVIPFCPKLRYISVTGNELDVLSGSALVEGLKNSNTLITLDLDYHKLPDLFKERIGLYTMRNMDKVLMHPEGNGLDTPDIQVDAAPEDSLSAQLQHILTLKADNKLDMNLQEVQEFTDRAKQDRENLRSAIGDLLHMQWKNQLNIEGKETLIRLLFIDASLERGLRLIDSSFSTDGGSSSQMNFFDINLAEKEELEDKTSGGAKPDALETKDLLDAHSLPFSRSQSLTSLNTLDKEEGSILKLLRLHGGEDTFLEKLKTYSGEELRLRLMDVDLSKLDRVIDYILKIKKEGFSIKSLFNEHPMKESDDTLGEFRQRLDHLLALLPNDGSEDARILQIPQNDSLDFKQTLPQEDINETLDQVLSRYNSHQ